EIEATGFDFTAMYQPSSKFKLWGSFSQVSGEVTSGGIDADLPFTSERKLKLGLTWYMGDFFITPTVHILDDINSVAATEETVDGSEIVHLYAGYNGLIEGLTLFMKVNNLLDEDYAHAGEVPVGSPAETPLA